MSSLSSTLNDRNRALNSEPPEEARHRDAAGALVRGVDVVLPFRIVELAGLGPDEYVIARQLAEIDGGLLHAKIDRGLRRQIFDEQDRQAFRRDLVHRPERHTVAMGERQALIDPIAVREALGVQLARRQHDLTVFTVDVVAVVVHRDEVVVGADLLDLAECLQAAADDPRA